MFWSKSSNPTIKHENRQNSLLPICNRSIRPLQKIVIQLLSPIVKFVVIHHFFPSIIWDIFLLLFRKPIEHGHVQSIFPFSIRINSYRLAIRSVMKSSVFVLHFDRVIVNHYLLVNHYFFARVILSEKMYLGNNFRQRWTSFSILFLSFIACLI